MPIPNGMKGGGVHTLPPLAPPASLVAAPGMDIVNPASALCALREETSDGQSFSGQRSAIRIFRQRRLVARQCLTKHL